MVTKRDASVIQSYRRNMVTYRCIMYGKGRVMYTNVSQNEGRDPL